jgi:hypothetical protein
MKGTNKCLVEELNKKYERNCHSVWQIASETVVCSVSRAYDLYWMASPETGCTGEITNWLLPSLTGKSEDVVVVFNLFL